MGAQPSTRSCAGGVRKAGDGREAVQLVKKLRPDVVVIDVLMHGIDGLQATAQIKALWPPGQGHCSVNVPPLYRSEAMAIGADALVGKGEAPDRLLDLLAVLMQRGT